MSEIKRVALNTLEPTKVSEKVIKKLCKTVRISVILPESNEEDCPEYNYKDQLAAVKKKVKQNKDTNLNGLENEVDPFGDNDDDVRRIALEMEAKYGSGVTGVSKKKRKGKKDDYADIGMGYDESDSFIDNTDGYDEIIPQNVTTLHGGFYVNSGALVFKTDDEASSAPSSSSSSSSESSSSDSEGEEKVKPKNRKRVLETSADSDSDTANNHKEKKPKLPPLANSMQQAIKKKLFSKDKIKVKKFDSLTPHKKTVKDLLRAKREDLNMSVPDELKTVEDNIEKESSKENKKPMSITSVTDAIESVVKQVVEETNYDKNQNKQPNDVPANATSVPFNVDSLESLSTDNDLKTERKRGEENKLPENLPTDITTIVSKLKEAAINYKGEGKKAFFTKDVNTLLLSLEKKSKNLLSKSLRVKVYEHLAEFVNCTKDTLMRRAKLLELEDGERRLTNIKTKLKDTIDAIMPNLIVNYEQESQKILKKKFSKDGIENEDTKNLKMPKKKFQWSEQSKKLVKDILDYKKRCLTIEGKHKDNLEEQISHFLRTVVLPLWPEGWMYTNILTKVYNSMQETAKSSSSSTSKLNESAILAKPSKHSSISIIPVTNGKNNTEKIEITNNLTVTKIHSDVIVNENIKSNTKHSEKVHSLAIANVSKDKEHDQISNSFSEKSKQTKSPDNLLLSIEKPSDLSTHVKKNDVFKPYINETSISQVQKQIKPTDSVKPSISQAPTILPEKEYPQQTKPSEMFKTALPQLQNTFSGQENPQCVQKPLSIETLKPSMLPDRANLQNVQKHTKHNDMFKPYADEVTHTEKSIPDKTKISNFSEKYLSHTDIIQQYPEKDKHSEKSKHSSHHNSQSTHVYSGKEKHSSHSHSESTHLYSGKEKHSSHSHSEKYNSHSHSDRHSSHSHSDKQNSHSHLEKDKHSTRVLTDKDKHNPHKHSSQGSDRKSEETSLYHTEKLSSRLENTSSDIPSDLSKSTTDKSNDLSKFQMFKPYSETPKSHHEETSKYKFKDDVIKQRHLEVTKPTKCYSRGDFIHSRYDIVSSKQMPSPVEDSGVIVKNLQPINEIILKDDKKDVVNPVISKTMHCQGVNLTDKRKLIESYKRASTELNPNFFPAAVNKHSDYSTSTPLVSNKSDGDGQKDIQMVMENLKALQKLSCSPLKNNDNSSSSPVSVIAYNKNFSTPKTISSQVNRNDSNSRNEFSGGFQDEFQKQFINSLQQMAASTSGNKSGYNNGS